MGIEEINNNNLLWDKERCMKEEHAPREIREGGRVFLNKNGVSAYKTAYFRKNLP